MRGAQVKVQGTFLASTRVNSWNARSQPYVLMFVQVVELIPHRHITALVRRHDLPWKEKNKQPYLLLIHGLTEQFHRLLDIRTLQIYLLLIYGLAGQLHRFIGVGGRHCMAME